MKLLVASLLLLSACATAPVRPAPEPWTAEPYIAMFAQCPKLFPGVTVRQCVCFADAMRAESPDPKSPATPDELVRGAIACGIGSPEPEEPGLTGGTKL